MTIVDDLLLYLAAGPTPFHAAAETAHRLSAAGFGPGLGGAAGAQRGVEVRGGTVIAWAHGGGTLHQFRLIGAHTDSPNLRVKPRPDRGSLGFAQLGVEVYGGVLLNSWLDRDLGIAGRVTLRGHAEPVLFRLDEPLARIPQLAIHLDRDVNERGLVLNRQQHLSPILGLGRRRFRDVVADRIGIASDAITAWDAMLFDLEAPRRVGLDGEFIASARIDNLASCHAATAALAAAAPPPGVCAVVALFDHEEVGSTTDRGASGSWLGQVLERIALGLGAPRGDFLAALARSTCVSSDCAHATHPNYAERHEPEHLIALNGGPVIKVNTSARYATEATTAAVFVEACDEAGVVPQWFVTRSDLACGSTIGPLTAAQLGIATVDVGIAQLAMHSCREMCGSADSATFIAVLRNYLNADR